MVVTEIKQEQQESPKNQFWTFSSTEKRLATAQVQVEAQRSGFDDQDISFTKQQKWRKLYSHKVSVRNEIENRKLIKKKKKAKEFVNLFQITKATKNFLVFGNI